MMTGTVLDILIYVFDRYMLEAAPDVPERDELVADLTRAGFGEDNVERALDWLADLAGECGRPAIDASGTAAVRVFSEAELSRLSTECRGLLLSLELGGVVTAKQREIVIERLLALGVEELDEQQVKWVVLMVLSSQPGQAEACARMESLVFDSGSHAPH